MISKSVCRFLINRVTGVIRKIVKKFGRIDVHECCCIVESKLMVI